MNIASRITDNGLGHRWTAFCLALWLAGCAHQPLEERGREDAYERLRAQAASASQAFANHNDQRRLEIERPGASAPDPEPFLPRYDPLSDVLVSLSMDNEDVRHVLSALARETGMNLSLHPSLASEARIVSLQFEQVPASKVFTEILQIADLHGEIDGNILRVSPFEERFYRLDFIETNLQASFELGGDVLGSGSGQSDQRLTGNFKLSGTGSTSSNPYDVLESTLNSLISDAGAYTLNRLAGSLYLRARPSVVRTVDRLLNRYRDMLGRQVLLEARIIEVGLSDSYRWGIDWSYVRNILDGTVGVAKAITQTIDTAGAINRTSTPGSTAPEVGLVLSRATANGSALLALSLLENFGDVKVLSNPTVRARHGQPTVISVGRSNTFIRESTTTTTAAATADAGSISTDIETDTVFDGLLLGVIPFIGDNGKISLSIHPIKSDVDEDSLELITVQNTAVSLPRVNLKEMSTSIRLNDGETVILGGLIDEVRTQVHEGMPGLSSLPGVGRLFSDEDMRREVRELVIVLRVTQL